MIKSSELKPSGKNGYRFSAQTASDLNLDLIRIMLLECNNEQFGLPITVTKEQIKSGNILKSTIEDCLILANTAHQSDYFKYCLTLRKQGKMATVSLQYYGGSVLTAKMEQTQERAHKGLSGMIGNALFGVDQSAYDAEYEYYAMLEELFQAAFQ